MYSHPADDDTPLADIKPTHSRLRQMTNHQLPQGRPRWLLHMQAVMWRFLMGIGMFLHRLASPRPPHPTFTRQIPSTMSSKPGLINLQFYMPRDYDTQKRLWTSRPEIIGVDVETGREESEEGSGGGGRPPKIGSRRTSMMSDFGSNIRRRSNSARRWGGYPVVINFHGGGFTLGSPGDDARWCGTVVDECHAVVISVDYRLAPEHPFPTAVEDGVDAVLWVHNHADELGINKDNIALSGFSSGGNMCFTVPLRLYDEITGFPRDDVSTPSPTPRQKAERALHGATSQTSVDETSSGSSTRVADPSSSPSQPSTLDRHDTPQELPAKPTKTTTTSTTTEAHTRPLLSSDVKIKCIISWYPPVDYTRTRAQRRATGRRPDQELPALFTDLFDDSYLHPPHTISLDSPYLSPGVAPTALLRDALPQEIILHTVEWDMLLSEGQDFHDRLISPEINKHVFYKMVEGVPHGWDKAPNPFTPTPGVREHYLRACKEMRRIFYGGAGATGVGKGGRPVAERMTTVGGWPTAAQRGSVQVVR